MTGRKDWHRKLHVVGFWASRANPVLCSPSPEVRLNYYMVATDALLEHECHVASFKIEGFVSGMNVRANPNVFADIAVDESPPPYADNDTLGNRMKAMVILARTVVGSFEKTFSSVGRDP